MTEKKWDIVSELSTIDCYILIVGDYRQIKNACGTLAQESGLHFMVEKIDYIFENVDPLFVSSNILPCVREAAKISVVSRAGCRYGESMKKVAQEIADRCDLKTCTLVGSQWTHEFRKS